MDVIIDRLLYMDVIIDRLLYMDVIIDRLLYMDGHVQVRKSHGINACSAQ